MYGTPKKSTRNITMLTVLVSQILLITTTSNVRAQTEDGVFKKWPLAWVAGVAGNVYFDTAACLQQW